MIRQVPMVEAKANLSRLVEDVAASGDVILITRNGRPIAQLSLPADVPPSQPLMPLGSRIHVGGLRRHFEAVIETSVIALDSLRDPGHGRIITIPQPNGAAVFVPIDAIEFVDVPLSAASLVRNIPITPDPEVLFPDAPTAEIIIASDARFRVTATTGKIVVSHLNSGTALVGFRPIDVRNNCFFDRLIYITRGHVNHILVNPEHVGGSPA